METWKWFTFIPRFGLPRWNFTRWPNRDSSILTIPRNLRWPRFLERFTDVRGPVNDSSCVRKPREPGTLDEVVHLEVGFNEEKISWRIRLLFLKNKYVLDTLVWLLFLEHPKTSPPWPRKREHKSPAIIHWTGKTCWKNPILSAPFVDNTIILCEKMKQNPWILSQQRWWMTRHVFSL